MPTLYMTKGLPASGKTTWAKKQNAKRVNKDDLRAMIDNGQWSKENERLILEFRDYIIKSCLKEGYDVVVDDTNLAPKHEANFRQICKYYEADFEIKDFTDVPLHECLKRDEKRENPVGEKVIRQMFNQFLSEKQDVAQYSNDGNHPWAVICDIDGTLAHMNGRSPFEWHRVGEDTVDTTVADLVRLEAGLGTPIIIFSGRDAICRQETIKWLKDNNIPFDDLWMRREGDMRKDNIVKKELFDEFVRDRYNVKYVLDDRNQVVDMWRNMGLKCLQVAPGEF